MRKSGMGRHAQKCGKCQKSLKPTAQVNIDLRVGVIVMGDIAW
jgi:hypothetical protein